MPSCATRDVRDRVLCSVLVATLTRMHPGFAGVVQNEWPRPRGFQAPERLDELSVTTLPGVGASLGKHLRALGIVTVRDLLLHRPRRYERAVDEIAISQLWGDDEVAIAGEVVDVRTRRIGGRRTIVTARVKDDTGTIGASWFNQPWLADKLAPGTHLRLRGRLGRYGFDVKSYDVGAARATADFAPVYPASERVPATRLRELARAALAQHGRFLPIRCRPSSSCRSAATHSPPSISRRRRRRPSRRAAGSPSTSSSRCSSSSPVRATTSRSRRRSERPATSSAATARCFRSRSQSTRNGRSWRSIVDLAQTAPMQRLLQGDVGSGKTVVALYALLRAVECGAQGALMAPTETLAEQHFLTVEPLCAALGVRAVLLTGSVSSKKIRAELANGAAHIAVGTHALIQRDIEFADLAVAVVDEQHRFGVEQRHALAEGRSPHVLHMTATPIPRTLALTIYGDLAVSEIAKPPADRKPIITAWVGAERSSEAYARLRVHLDAGRQAYVVCPLIEQSETRLARAAEVEAERLRRAELRGLPGRAAARAS